VRGTLHWVSAPHAVKVSVRLYDRLFTKPNPEEVKEGEDFLVNLNPHSCEELTGCLVEPSLAGAKPGSRYQFLRQGYFCLDEVNSTPEKLVFNQIVPLRDSWKKTVKSSS
jgi:glutaminyl-tRNA synthetase